MKKENWMKKVRKDGHCFVFVSTLYDEEDAHEKTKKNLKVAVRLIRDFLDGKKGRKVLRSFVNKYSPRLVKKVVKKERGFSTRTSGDEAPSVLKAQYEREADTTPGAGSLSWQSYRDGE